MTLPVVDVTLPASIRYASNGNLPDAFLTPVDAHGGRMHPTAVRALHAMLAALGQPMTYTSIFDTYRPYGVQLLTFTARYRPVSKTEFDLNDAVDRKLWADNPDGQRYWVKRGNVATAAVPGTSNHGYGLAIDLARGTSPSNAVYIGDEGTPITEWLKHNASRFGFSGETQSEPWHWRYWSGDVIPAAVLAYEHPTHPPEVDDMPLPILAYWKGKPGYVLTDLTSFWRYIGSVDEGKSLVLLGRAVWGDQANQTFGPLDQAFYSNVPKV